MFLSDMHVKRKNSSVGSLAWLFLESKRQKVILNIQTLKLAAEKGNVNVKDNALWAQKTRKKDSLISERKIIFFRKGLFFWYKVLINLIGRIKYSILYYPFQQYSVTAQLVPLCDLSPWRHLTTAFIFKLKHSYTVLI